MKVDFDGLRNNASYAYNEFVTDELLEKLNDEEKACLEEIRYYICAFNCLYLPECKNNYYELKNVYQEEEEEEDD